MSKTTIITRAALVLGVLGVTVTGVTLAAFNDTATLTSNTVSSETADLLVDGSDVDAVATDSEVGFSFTNLFPGAAAFSPTQTLTLKNNGTSDMKVTVYATGGVASGTLDKSKVFVKFTNGADTATYTLQQLVDLYNDVPGAGGAGVLLGGASETVDVSVALGADAVSGAGGALTNFDLVFTGTGVE